MYSESKFPQLLFTFSMTCSSHAYMYMLVIRSPLVPRYEGSSFNGYLDGKDCVIEIQDVLNV